MSTCPELREKLTALGHTGLRRLVKAELLSLLEKAEAAAKTEFGKTAAPKLPPAPSTGTSGRSSATSSAAISVIAASVAKGSPIEKEDGKPHDCYVFKQVGIVGGIKLLRRVAGPFLTYRDAGVEAARQKGKTIPTREGNKCWKQINQRRPVWPKSGGPTLFIFEIPSNTNTEVLPFLEHGFIVEDCPLYSAEALGPKYKALCERALASPSSMKNPALFKA